MSEAEKAVNEVQRIETIDKILEIVTRLSGLRTALVVRLSEDEWVPCAMLDEAEWGIGVGQSLDPEGTY